jgi:hypothetical protein
MRRLTASPLVAWVALALLGAARPAPTEPAEELEQPTDLRHALTEPQRAWWDRWDLDGLDVQALLCGRRAGKSTLLAYWIVDGGAHGPPGSWSIYVSLTAKHAKRAMWRQMKAAAARTGREHVVLEGELTIHFAGGGSVMLAGSDTEGEIDKFRSLAIYRVAVDECGKQRQSLLQYLDEDVLEPACMDHGGKRAYAGTPASVPIGWWFELTRLRKADEPELIPVGRWTALDNPHIKNPSSYFAKVLKRKGWHETHPKFVREYLGQWVLDFGELVFPLDRDRPGWNSAADLPTHTIEGAWLDPARWRFSIGIDLGFVHASAFVVVASHPGLAHEVFVCSSEKHVGWIAPQIRDRLRALKALYPNAVVVADAGGYGKGIVEEIRRLWASYVENAKKTDKPGQIRLVRDMALAGHLKLLDRVPSLVKPVANDGQYDAANDALYEECGAMGWDPDDPTRPNPLAEDHAIDAMLYAIRRLHHYVQDDAAPPPTAEQQAEAERKKKFALFAAINRGKKAARAAGGYR